MLQIYKEDFLTRTCSVSRQVFHPLKIFTQKLSCSERLVKNLVWNALQRVAQWLSLQLTKYN